MTQYDAAATPMWRCFDTVAQASLFKAILPQVDLNQMNTVQNEWQRRSEGFNIAKEDANNDLEFNWVLWHGLKVISLFPAPAVQPF